MRDSNGRPRSCLGQVDAGKQAAQTGLETAIPGERAMSKAHSPVANQARMYLVSALVLAFLYLLAFFAGFGGVGEAFYELVAG